MLTGEPSIFKTFTIAGLIAFCAVSPSGANPCIAFEDAVQLASTNFQKQPSTQFAPTGAPPNKCDVAASIDGTRIYHCRWDFGYRAPEAFSLMGKLNDDIQSCLGVQSRKIEDGVNHPDTYEQRLYRLGEINISLSLKDKAALRESFVFLRISGTEPD